MEPSPRIIDIAWKEQVASGKDVAATNGAKLYSFVSYWNIWIGYMMIYGFIGKKWI